MAVAPAKSTVFIDNQRTCVTEWRFVPGAETGWHRHAYDYTVVPMLDGNLSIDNGEGKISLLELVAGRPYFRTAGVQHNVVNANTFDYVFIEIEYKS